MVTKVRNNNKIKYIKLFLFGGVFLFCVYFVFASKLLGYQKKVATHNYLLEGWISPLTLERFANEIKNAKKDYLVVVSGCLFNKTVAPYYKSEQSLQDKVRLYGNAVVYLPCNVKGISIVGQKAEGYSAFYTVSAGNEIVHSGFSPIKDSVIIFGNELSEKNTGTFVSFTNDIRSGNQDRNLYLNPILYENHGNINEKKKIRVFKGKYDISGYKSESDLVKNYLTHLGIRKEKIVSITYGKSYNKTWESARAVAAYLSARYPNKMDGLQIVTEDFHSLRSYIAYRRWLPKDVKLGVQYYQYQNKSLRDKLINPFPVIDESISIIITLFKAKK